jgi:hypothetical protein
MVTQIHTPSSVWRENTVYILLYSRLTIESQVEDVNNIFASSLSNWHTECDVRRWRHAVGLCIFMSRTWFFTLAARRVITTLKFDTRRGDCQAFLTNEHDMNLNLQRQGYVTLKELNSETTTGIRVMVYWVDLVKESGQLRIVRIFSV